jgi:hypothetical protein
MIINLRDLQVWSTGYGNPDSLFIFRSTRDRWTLEMQEGNVFVAVDEKIRFHFVEKVVQYNGKKFFVMTLTDISVL